jgi:phosphoglycerol transferase MdoB-like AlkP superfamily enzyme
VLESWSPYQSKLWSGIEDWTPRLDAIAQQNAWFTRLHAGGFTTNEGLLAILAGLEFLSPPKSYFDIMPFETGWETPASIPRTLVNNQGYHTAFLTTGNLGFTRKGRWLRNLGFTYVEGHRYEGYEGHQRLHFDAVADELLYARSLDYIRANRDQRKPLFLTIENVSSHHPYIHPVTGQRSAKAVFSYMDSTVHAFYEQLQDSDFFDNGILLIVGDHRAMIPVTPAETERFGQAAVSLVPAIVVGSELQGEIAAPFHQSDILPTLDRLTANEHCYTGAYRSLLEPELSERRCIYHARGDNRDHIDAFCPLLDGSEARAVVGLYGDDTQVLESRNMSPELERQVLLEINTHRVLGDERTRSLLESGYFD